MAWTTPRTWVSSELVTASIMNTHVRDNLNELGAAKVTTAGDLIYASGSHALARLGIGSSGQFLTVSGGLPSWQAPSYGTWIKKAADESLNTNTTLQDDNHLTFAIGASEVWIVEIYLLFAASGAGGGGIKAAFSVPASCTGYFSSYSLGGNTRAFQTTITTATNLGVSATSDFVWLKAIIINSTNAGNVVFQWAQQASDSDDSTVKQNSVMYYKKVA